MPTQIRGQPLSGEPSLLVIPGRLDPFVPQTCGCPETTDLTLFALVAL